MAGEIVFTGIVEEVGTLDAFEPHDTGARLRIRCSTVLSDTKIGDSVAVNGVCLTAVAVTESTFSAELAPETIRRTNLGDLKVGSLVNLERPLAANGRFSGHVVQGHVDGTAEFLSFDLLGDENWWLRVKIPQELDKYVVFKGSIAIDGISLTVAEIKDRVVSITIIPHTYHNTSLRGYKPGDRINIESDIFAKYLEKMIKSE
jgi:riboflavin synthase